MHTAGLLSLRTNLYEGQLVKFGVTLRRPAVTPLFLGQTPDKVVQTVPLLYNVCAQAQQLAAQAALDGAVGRTTVPTPATGLWMEMLHEILWRLLLDWPPALGLPAEKEAFVAWRSARHGENAYAETEHLCHGLVADLSAKCMEKMPSTPVATLQHANMLDPAAWLDSCVGKTDHVPTLRPPSSIRAAYQGRIAQLHGALHALLCQSAYPVAVAAASGWGVAQVPTARGILTHAAQVAGGRVGAYRVWAPTDAFFADSSALCALLEGGTYDTTVQARSALELAVLALDPCVPFEVEMDDA
jgi:hypothetical protein